MASKAEVSGDTDSTCRAAHPRSPTVTLASAPSSPECSLRNLRNSGKQQHLLNGLLKWLPTVPGRRFVSWGLAAVLSRTNIASDLQ